MVCHKGLGAHDGTWKSAVYGLADEDNLKKLRKQIGYAPVPVVGAKLKKRYKRKIWNMQSPNSSSIYDRDCYDVKH